MGSFRTCGLSALTLMLSCCLGWGHDIFIYGLFPMEGAWRGGRMAFEAAELALLHINTRDDVLPGYNLRMVWNNTKCDPGLGVDGMFRNFYHDDITIQMILGAGCSLVSQSTSQAAHLWNQVQISYISTSPALSDKKRFPRFFRLNAPDTKVNPARVEIIKQFGWKRVATIHQSLELFSTILDGLLDELALNNISVITSEIFRDDPKTQIENLKKHDARIIIGDFYEDMAFKVFCEAYKQQLYGPKIVWMITGWLEEFWWLNMDNSTRVDCTVDQLKEAIEGHFAIRTIYLNPKEERGIAGFTPSEFQEAYRNKTNGQSFFGDIKASLSYDCTWAIALALNATLTNLTLEGNNVSLENFTYTNTEMGLLHFKHMQQVNFQGIRGPTFFDANGDPETLMSLDRVQDGIRETIGLYNPAVTNASKIEWYIQPKLTWKNGRLPKDAVDIIVRIELVSPILFAVFSLLAAVGIMVTLSFLVFNQYFRRERIIKMSSPRLNNLILIGCSLIYMTVFFEDIDGSTPALCWAGAEFCTTNTISLLTVSRVCKGNFKINKRSEYFFYNYIFTYFVFVASFFVLVKQVKTLFLVVGFSLTFGGLFSKTWRVYVIFTNPKLERKVVKDRKLFVMVGILLAVNMSVFVTWQCIDPQKMRGYNSTPEIADNGDTIYQPQINRCESTYQLYFLGILYAIQGILLLFGSFLAWETRKVKLQALNDSHFIGLSIYNVVILSLLAVLVSLFVDENVNLLFGLLAAITVFGTTATQSLVFLPKVLNFKESRTGPSDDTVAPIHTLTASMAGNRKLALLEKENKEKEAIIEGLRQKLKDAEASKKASP